MKTLFTTVFLLVGFNCFSQEIQKRQITQGQIDAIFSQWDTTDEAGIAVGVVSDGNTILTKGYGLANLEHKIAIRPDTKFHIGDLAKEFTVYAILLLEHRNQLSLQDDIRDYLPNLMPFSHAITIEQLIHHTSGLNNIDVAKALAGWKAEDVFTKEQAYAMIRNQNASLTSSGSEQRHSDTGFMILEDLIAKISNRSYEDFITQEIFIPLGMTNSVFDTQGAVIANKAQGYFSEGDNIVNATMNHAHTIVSDLYTTVEDMCLWANELGKPKIGTEQMVNKFDGLSEVNKQKVAEANLALYTGGHRFWNYRGAKKLYHIEVAGGYASKLIRYPEYDLAIVVMGNDGAYNGNAATAGSELYIEDFLDAMPDTQSTEINSIKLSKTKLAAFAGQYWDSANHSSRKIHVVNDTLRYFRGPGNESALVPLSANSFKMITRGEVGVSFDTKSSPTKMTVTVEEDIFHSMAYDSNEAWTKNLDVFTGNYYAADLGTAYTLEIDQGILVITHPRLDRITLEPRITDVFSGNRAHFSSIAFNRDTNGNVTGFHLATAGVADIWFQKKTSPQEYVAKTK